MSDPALKREPIRFGAFEFDGRSGELRKYGLRIRLQGQPIEILAIFLSRPGELVTREELQKELWGSDTFIDFERSLNAAIKRLRAALGDSAESPRFIETLARKGYRFVAPVESNRVEAEPHEGAMTAPAMPVAPEAAVRARSRKAFWTAAAVVVLGLALFGRTAIEIMRGRGQQPAIDSLLVLPFQNLSPDPEQDYFADGITDALNARLAGISALRVISQTSSLQYKGTNKPLSEIGRELNVAGIVEGSVLRSGDQVRINVKLVQPGVEKRIWGNTYIRNVRDVLALQSEVTRAIVDEIRVRLTPGEQTRLTNSHPPNPEAHTAYVKGRIYWNKRTDEGLRKAIEFFQEAIARDEDYALAHVGLADAWVARAWYAYLPPADAFVPAKAAVHRALQLDPDLAEAHTTLGFLRLYYEWDRAGAEREFLRAIELNSNYANAHHWYGEHLSLEKRHDSAIREAERARELDPLSSIINTWVGSRYYFARRFDTAAAQYRNVVDMDPSFVPAHFALGQAYLQNRMLPEAIRELESAVELSGGSPMYVGSLAHAYGVAGRRKDALAAIERLNSGDRRNYVAAFDIALGWLGLGDPARVLALLERAVQDRSPRVMFLDVDPRFDPLRSDDRFQTLIARIGPTQP